MSFENERFIIVCAAGGIGSALSRRLKKLGAQPILMGRTADQLALLSQELDATMRVVYASNAAELEAAVAAYGPVRLSLSHSHILVGLHVEQEDPRCRAMVISLQPQQFPARSVTPPNALHSS